MSGAFAGFDWDRGNLTKCQQHGVTLQDIESLFDSPLMILPDAEHSKTESRPWAIGKTATGRWVLLVYTIRRRAGQQLIRPSSARFMHAKEIAEYEEENPTL